MTTAAALEFPSTRFDPDLHEYFVRDTLAPGVTSVIEHLYRNRDRFTDLARARGSMIHKIISYSLQEDLDPSTIDPRLLGHVNAAQGFLATIGLKPSSAWLIEEPLYHSSLMFAGTPDLVVSTPDAIYDWKSGSGSIDPVAALQTAGYEILVDRPCRRFAVSLREDGRFKLVEFKDRSDKGMFLGLLAAYNRYIMPARLAEVGRRKKEEAIA